MPVSIRGSAGGSVTLSSGAAASDTTLTLPNTTGTVALTASPTFTGTTTVASLSATGTISSVGAASLGLNGASSGYVTAQGSANTTNTGFFGFYTSAGTRQAYIGYIGTPNDALNIETDSGSNKPIRFATNATEAARIDSSGNLLVGTTAQLNGAYGSKVNVQAGASNGIAVAGSAANWSALVVFNASNTLIGYLNATQSNISLVNVSDYRLKKNVTPLSGGLANISALTPVTYDWTNSDESGEGFIAHELQAVIPHAVTGEKDAVNEDGSVKPQGVDYSKIVVHLVAAIQELSAKNDALEARLAALEAASAAPQA